MVVEVGDVVDMQILCIVQFVIDSVQSIVFQCGEEDSPFSRNILPLRRVRIATDATDGVVARRQVGRNVDSSVTGDRIVCEVLTIV